MLLCKVPPTFNLAAKYTNELALFVDSFLTQLFVMGLHASFRWPGKAGSSTKLCRYETLLLFKVKMWVLRQVKCSAGDD